MSDNILEPNINGLPPITDWQKVFLVLQQANEAFLRGATLPELGKQIIGDVQIQGADFVDLPVAEDSTPVALPIPETGNKFGFLADGKFTQPTGGTLEYSATQWGLTLFDGDKWVKKFTLDLPDSKLSNWSAGTYTTNTSKIKDSNQYRVKSGVPTSEEPSEYSVNWEIVSSLFSIDDPKKAKDRGKLYKYKSSLTTFQIQVAGSGNNLRQLRSNPNTSGLPVIEYADSADGGNTWGDYKVFVGYQTLFDGFSSTPDTMFTPGIFKEATGIRQVGQNGSKTRQIRTLFNYSGKPRLVYRDHDGTSWGPEQNLYNDFGFDAIITATQLNSYITPGNVLVSGNNPYPVNISAGSGQIRQIKTLPNLSGEPIQLYRDSTDSGVTWTEFLQYGISDRKFKVLSTSEDMMWSWWNYPVIIRSSEKLNKIYVSYTDSLGETGVYSRSLDDGSQIKAPVKLKIEDIDDHNAGAILKLPNGRILTAFASGHAKTGRFFTANSEKKDDISRWIDAGSANIGGAISYGQLLPINGKLLFFTRQTASTGFRWMVSISSDNSKTWGTGQTVLFTSTSLQWYALFRPVTDNPDLIRILHCSHPTQSSNDIRGGFIKISTGEILDVDGTTVKGMLGADNDALSFSIIVNKGAFTLRLLDTVPTPTHEWKILYVRFNNGNDGVYCSYESGTTYQLIEAGPSFLPASFYYSGAVFGEDGDIFLVRRASGNSIVEKWIRNESGYSWNSEIDRNSKWIIRPVYAEGVIGYLKGYYNPLDYKDFLMTGVFKEL